MYERSVRDWQDMNDCFNITDEETRKDVFGDNSTPLRKIFKEICYVSRVTVDEAELYLNYLENRIDDIEEVV
jgi:hypothetical protein